MNAERTLVIIKPDGVARNLVGIILQTFERAELRLIHLQMMRATVEQVLEHYTDDTQWLETAGNRAIEAMRGHGVDPFSLTGVTTAPEVGSLIRQRLVDYMCSGPLVVVIVEGIGAISKVRQLVGSTLPQQAAPGSIRGRYCSDDVITSFTERRALHNLVHASGTAEEFEQEMKVWLDAFVVTASKEC